MFLLWPVNRLFSVVRGSGDRIEFMLREAGVDPGGNAGLDEEIAAARLARLLRRGLRLSRDELWGLGPGPIKLGTFSQACRSAVQARTVEGALRAAFRTYRAATDDFAVRLTRDGDQARLTLVDRVQDQPGREALHVLLLYVLLVGIEWLSGQTCPIDRIEFQFPPVPHLTYLEALFQCRFVTGATRTSLILGWPTLDRPVVVDVQEVRTFVSSILDKLALPFEGQRSLADRAASYIKARDIGAVTLEEVAAVLNLSVDTLSRRLNEETGAGFKDLKDRIRFAAAIDLIEVGQSNLDTVAQKLGFSELSSFHRAFKRWTGLGPGVYRQSLHELRPARTR